MDRSGPIAQHLHGRGFGPAARRAVPAGLGTRTEDHLLPSDDGRDPCREVDHPVRPAQRGAERVRLPGRMCLEARAGGLFRVRGLPVRSGLDPQSPNGRSKPPMLSWNEPAQSAARERPSEPSPRLAEVPAATAAPAASPAQGRVRAEDKRIINGHTDVNQLVPLKYKWAWDKYLSACANHWMPQEVNMARDIALWKDPRGLTE